MLFLQINKWHYKKIAHFIPTSALCTGNLIPTHIPTLIPTVFTWNFWSKLQMKICSHSENQIFFWVCSLRKSVKLAKNGWNKSIQSLQEELLQLRAMCDTSEIILTSLSPKVENDSCLMNNTSLAVATVPLWATVTKGHFPHIVTQSIESDPQWHLFTNHYMHVIMLF